MAGLLDIFGTGGTQTLGLLGMSPEDIQSSRDDAQAQALYGLAARLFQGGNTGQSIAEGLQQGQKMYRSAMDTQLQDKLQGYQLQELFRKRKQEEDALARQNLINRAVAGAYQPGIAAIPAQMVEEEGRYIGETPAVAGRAAGLDLATLSPLLMASPEGRKTLGELVTAQKAFRPETFTLAEGAQQFERDPFTGQVTQVAVGAPKREPVTADIQGFNLARSQGFNGSFLDYQTALKRAGAQNTILNVANKTFGSEFAKGAGESINNAFTAAQGAVSTLGRIEALKPILEGGKLFSGTFGTSQVAGSRIADVLNIGGKDNAERLRNTSVAMQQLAGLELNAAEAMKGQGTITENERSLIARAAGGDLMKMTAQEVSALLVGLEKTSKYKINIHENNLKRLKQNPELSAIAQYYELPTIPTVQNSGAAGTAENAGLPSGVTVKRK